MIKILVLGHKGMLGNAVYRYFTQNENYEVQTVGSRFGTEEFTRELQATDADCIINCIGLIPQKKPTPEEYKVTNVDLPIFLETLGKKIVHPSTDCEFNGTISPSEKYTKQDTRDATDDYGKSKADISKLIEESFIHTKIIRTSIIGHEQNSHVALLDWFLHAEGEVNGYTNHYWNGTTTLQWAKLCEELITSWDTCPVLNQYGTKDNRSKYDLLVIAREVYQKTITINPFEAPISINKCLVSDKEIPDIDIQLRELKSFYGK